MIKERAVDRRAVHLEAAGDLDFAHALGGEGGGGGDFDGGGGDFEGGGGRGGYGGGRSGSGGGGGGSGGGRGSDLDDDIPF